MLIVLDSDKQKLEDMDVKFVEFSTPKELYIEEFLNASVETCMGYEEIEPTLENLQKSFRYINDESKLDINKVVNKIKKSETEIFNMIYEIFNGHKEDILAVILKEETENK